MTRYRTVRRWAAAGVIVLVGCAAPRTAPSPDEAGGQTASPSPSVSAPSAEPHIRFAAVGDIGDGSPNETAVADAIAAAHAEEPIDLLLLLGDLIYQRGRPEQYEQRFATPYKKVLDANIPIAAVLGNHDIFTDTEGVMRAFGMPSRFYTITRKHVQFLALDNSKGVIDRVQRKWMLDELARSDAPWKVAFMHFPAFSSGKNGSTPQVEQTIVEPFREHGVQLALAGHDHDYQRTHPLGGITTYIVSGGGCCPHPPAPVADFHAKRADGLHFLLLEVEGDRMALEAITPEGEFLDLHEIRLTAARDAA
ncbi:MAG: metallophosphoesterase family protein [Actinomycetota bacterium]